ncbi:hypothetical protein [Nemorincola caseinilytica]
MKRIAIFICCTIISIAFSACAQNNMLQEGLALKYLVREPRTHAGKPPVAILMHGYGSNEADLFELAQFFPDDFLVISVRAPYPQGPTGFQWFEKDRSKQKYTPIKAQVEDSRDLLLKFIPQVVSWHHADAANIYVMGFSQGAIMSYEVGLTSPATIKGIGILSGGLPTGLEKEIKPSPTLSRLRIFIAHGTADNILSYQDGKDGYDQLVKLGLKPELHTYTGMAHTITSQVVADLVKWLKS